jgi:snRNA-activating protein complex subunit 3
LHRPYFQIVAVVRVYRPVKSTNRIPTVMFNKLRYNQEIYLLGSNKLSELRDFIKCPMDVMRPGDVSKDPSKVAQGKRANEMYKGGFFYINGCFYNDTRWPECIDYSKVIREWASSKKRGIGPFRVLKMEDTLIRDLDLRLGFPYVYVHQGEHEHVFSINDVRLVRDSPNFI